MKLTLARPLYSLQVRTQLHVMSSYVSGGSVRVLHQCEFLLARHGVVVFECREMWPYLVTRVSRVLHTMGLLAHTWETSTHLTRLDMTSTCVFRRVWS